MSKGENVSRFKIYISKLLKDIRVKKNVEDELKIFKKVKKNVASIITTNYDTFLDAFFEFEPLIGNDILLSNPYGSIYKIHGCVSSPKDIIITSEDYHLFNKKYELIRAQLLSIFMNNPIIFLGYNVGDENIVKLLETIFSYVNENTPEAARIRSNFLLVEYEKDSKNLEISDHDIRLNDRQTIRINKIKTDDFISIYESLSNLQIRISAMDIRKVQNIVKEIYKNGDIKVEIVENIDSLENKDKVLAIGSRETLKYEYKPPKDFIEEYFNIIEEENTGIIALIDKFKIQSQQYFPIYGFYKLFPKLTTAEALMFQQENRIHEICKSLRDKHTGEYTSIECINESDDIKKSYKWSEIYLSVYNDNISLSEFESYLKVLIKVGIDSNYRKLLCLYDYKKYKD